MSEFGSAFDLAPVAMWIEDFSAVRAQLDAWRAEGITDLRQYLTDNLDCVAASARKIRVLAVNDATLQQFSAPSQEALIAGLDQIFRDEMLGTHIEELSQLWAGQSAFQSMAVNYTLGGEKLFVQLKARALPGHEEDLARVLLVTENVTERECALAAARQAGFEAQGLFRHSPVSLWIEDFSDIHARLEELRHRGIVDLRTFTDVHPQFVRQCIQSIRVLEVNAATLDLFGAKSQEQLFSRMKDVLRDNMEAHFREQLIELWNGNYQHSREVVNYALDGSERSVIMQFSIMPGHEARWDRVMIALTDITARKKAEAYLSWLGKHDVLTGLNNRAHFIEMLNNFMRQKTLPLSLAIIDLDGLKLANDLAGHDVGDALLRRVGEVLREAVQGTGADAARIGGDEFAILMPNFTEAEAQSMIDSLHQIVHVNNKYYSARPLAFSVGVATLEPGESQEAMILRADAAMYHQKRSKKAPLVLV